MKNSRRSAALVFICSVALLSIAVNSQAQENLSQGRSLGIGVPISILPWPFIEYALSDTLDIHATALLLPGVVAVSASAEYRIVDGPVMDAKAYVGAAVGSIVGIPTVSATAGIRGEYSLSRNFAIQAHAGISMPLTSLGGLGFMYGLTVTYYFLR